MPLRSPDDCVCIVVDDDRNVLVSLLVACLVNADVHEVIKPSGAFGFDVIQCSVDAASDCFPVDAHVL